MSYNFDSKGECAKHQVNLVYDNDDANAPLSLQMLGSTPLVRMHKLHAIDVTARESAANSPQPCSGPMRSLRTYNLAYQNDADTGQFQLHRVTMSGQENTDERNDTLPVATYTYGQVTSNGELNYQLRQRVTSFPSGYDTSFAIARTLNFHCDPVWPPDQPAPDGRRVYREKSPRRQRRWPARSSVYRAWYACLERGAQQAGSRQSHAIALSRLSMMITSDARSSSTKPNRQPRQMDQDGQVNGSQVWVQMIDMNADGRVDLVAANETLNSWVVYLNKPDPQDPNLHRLDAARNRYPPAPPISPNLWSHRPEGRRRFSGLVEHGDGARPAVQSLLAKGYVHRTWQREQSVFFPSVLRMWRGRLISTTRRSRNGSCRMSMATAIPISSSMRPLSASWMHPNRLRRVG